MIKRILKTKLRVYLYKSIGEAANFESAFNWVYTSPIWEWKLRVLCLTNSVDYPILNNEYAGGIQKNYQSTARELCKSVCPA